MDNKNTGQKLNAKCFFTTDKCTHNSVTFNEGDTIFMPKEYTKHNNLAK